MAVVGAVALCRMRFRPWMYTWGADDDEVTAVLPGRRTRVLAHHADHAGVDHRRTHCGGVALAGAGRRGPRRVLQLFVAGTGLWARTSKTQTPSTPSGRTCVGDTVWLARHYGDAAKQVVAAVAPGAHLVLMLPGDFERVQHGMRASDAWGFYLRRKDGWTRLIARGAVAPSGTLRLTCPFRHGAKDDARYPRSCRTDASRPGPCLR